jgi:hypothetical protein
MLSRPKEDIKIVLLLPKNVFYLLVAHGGLPAVPQSKTTKTNQISGRLSRDRKAPGKWLAAVVP